MSRINSWSKGAVLLLLVGASTVYASGADSPVTQTGSADDPLVSKSYLEQYVKQMLPAASTAPQASAPTPAPSQGYVVLTLSMGQTLYAGAGTELIVRSGNATAVSSDENGIPDVTAGKDVAAGAAVELNHLLISPKEGRGIRTDPKLKQVTFVMVRGGYLIMNADGTKSTP